MTAPAATPARPRLSGSAKVRTWVLTVATLVVLNVAGGVLHGAGAVVFWSSLFLATVVLLWFRGSTDNARPLPGWLRAGPAEPRYCLHVYGPEAAQARLEPISPEFAARLDGLDPDLPIERGVLFLRGDRRLSLLEDGAIRIAAYDAAGNRLRPPAPHLVDRSVRGPLSTAAGVP